MAYSLKESRSIQREGKLRLFGRLEMSCDIEGCAPIVNAFGKGDEQKKSPAGNPRTDCFALV